MEQRISWESVIPVPFVVEMLRQRAPAVAGVAVPCLKVGRRCGISQASIVLINKLITAPGTNLRVVTFAVAPGTVDMAAVQTN